MVLIVIRVRVIREDATKVCEVPGGLTCFLWWGHMAKGTDAKSETGLCGCVCCLSACVLTTTCHRVSMNNLVVVNLGLT